MPLRSHCQRRSKRPPLSLLTLMKQPRRMTRRPTRQERSTQLWMKLTLPQLPSWTTRRLELNGAPRRCSRLFQTYVFNLFVIFSHTPPQFQAKLDGISQQLLPASEAGQPVSDSLRNQITSVAAQLSSKLDPVINPALLKHADGAKLRQGVNKLKLLSDQPASEVQDQVDAVRDDLRALQSGIDDHAANAASLADQFKDDLHSALVDQQNNILALRSDLLEDNSSKTQMHQGLNQAADLVEAVASLVGANTDLGQVRDQLQDALARRDHQLQEQQGDGSESLATSDAAAAALSALAALAKVDSKLNDSTQSGASIASETKTADVSVKALASKVQSSLEAVPQATTRVAKTAADELAQVQSDLTAHTHKLRGGADVQAVEAAVLTSLNKALDAISEAHKVGISAHHASARQAVLDLQAATDELALIADKPSSQPLLSLPEKAKNLGAIVDQAQNQIETIKAAQEVCAHQQIADSQTIAKELPAAIVSASSNLVQAASQLDPAKHPKVGDGGKHTHTRK